MTVTFRWLPASELYHMLSSTYTGSLGHRTKFVLSATLNEGNGKKCSQNIVEMEKCCMTKCRHCLSKCKQTGILGGPMPMIGLLRRQPTGDGSHKPSSRPLPSFCQARGYLPSFRATPPLAGTSLYCSVMKQRHVCMNDCLESPRDCTRELIRR